MSTQPIPDLSTISIPLRRPAPATPAADTTATAATPATAQPTMADDGKSVSFDTTAGEAEAIDMDRALDLALAVADGQLSGTEAKRLGMDRNSLRTLLEATADGRIDGKELARLAPKKGALPIPQRTPTGGTGAATGANTPVPANQAQPAQTPAQPAAPANGETYTIKPGDTLSKIAKAQTNDPQRYKELLALNPHIKNPDKIFPGQKLTLPASWAKNAPATPATGQTPATGTGQTPATGTPAAAAAPGQDTLDEAKAMLETSRYIQQNFDKVAGGDSLISKDDLQKNLPEGPGKQAFLRKFDDLKFQSIDPGAEAWTNLTKKDIDGTTKSLEYGVEQGHMPYFADEAYESQHVHNVPLEFKALDKDGNGQLSPDEVPDRLKGSREYNPMTGMDLGRYTAARDDEGYLPARQEAIARMQRQAQAPAAPAVSSRISGEAEVKAMQATSRYLEANFDKVAGADGLISKEDLQQHLPEGPGKAAFLKHFDDLKHMDVDTGATADSNLSRDDLDEIGRTLDWRAGEGGPLDWQFHAEAHQHLHKNDAAFKAADRDGNGRLEGEEIPADMRGKPSHLGGSSLNRTDFAEHRELVEFGKMMDDSGERVEAWKRAQGMPAQATPTQRTPGTITNTTPVGNGAQPATQTPATNAQPATTPPLDAFTADDELEFARLDYSGDGVINNDGGAPYRNNVRFDANKDGEITRQEFVAGRAAERKGKDSNEIRAVIQDEDDFARLDRSGDGVINNDGGTPYRNNAQYDTNKDNEITQQEFLAGRAAERKNGRPGVTAEQATLSQKADSDFDELDLSGDGVINNDGGAPYRNNARFDTNKDNEITRDEYVQGRVKEGR